MPIDTHMEKLSPPVRIFALVAALAAVGGMLFVFTSGRGSAAEADLALPPVAAAAAKPAKAPAVHKTAAAKAAAKATPAPTRAPALKIPMVARGLRRRVRPTHPSASSAWKWRMIETSPVTALTPSSQVSCTLDAACSAPTLADPNACFAVPTACPASSFAAARTLFAALMVSFSVLDMARISSTFVSVRVCSSSMQRARQPLKQAVLR